MRDKFQSFATIGGRTLCVFTLTMFLAVAAGAQNPCGSDERRALVLSGGGAKGAFQTGAIYHLVVHRGCDFHEFSGVSVGALNAALLAQAAREADAAESQHQLVEQAEALVSLWESIHRKRDIAKPRMFATVRFAAFGLDSFNDFLPLRRLLEEKVTPERLAQGRPLTVGVVLFSNGRYREVQAGPMLNAKGPFLDYLYGSAVPPLFGRLPMVAERSRGSDVLVSTQLADGGVRHITPVTSYFRKRDEDPVHARVQQLFVIVTSPYTRGSDLLPVTDSRSCRAGTCRLTNGSKILKRTLALVEDVSYRWDLDFMLFVNDVLRWRAQGRAGGPEAFPVESYNRDDRDADAPSLPYQIGLVAPQREFGDLSNLLDFSRQGTREQLYCGCVAADKMMQRDFGLPSAAGKCAERFPPLGAKGKRPPAEWEPLVCEAPTPGQPAPGQRAAN